MGRPANRQAVMLDWAERAFGDIADVRDVGHRSRRFLEEAAELCQAAGLAEDEALAVVRYVYGRERGEPFQEIGGVMVTLLVLAEVLGLSVHEAEETEVARVLAVPPDRFRRRQIEKIGAGL